MKKGLSLLLTVIFVMSLSVSAFANSTSGELSVNEVKSAEQSVLDFFAAVQNNDYDTLNRVSVDKHMSDEVRRNTLELQHEEAVIPEKPTILSSEKCSEDMVMVKVSYVMAGKERIMTYPVVLVNNEWIVNVGDAVDPSVAGVLWESIVPVTDNSKITRQDWTYNQTLNVGRWYLPFYITHSALVAYIQGWQNNPNGSVNVSYGICYKSIFNTWEPTGKPKDIIIKNNWVNNPFFQTYKELKGTNIQLAVEVGITRNGTRIWGNIFDGP